LSVLSCCCIFSYSSLIPPCLVSRPIWKRNQYLRKIQRLIVIVEWRFENNTKNLHNFESKILVRKANTYGTLKNSCSYRPASICIVEICKCVKLMLRMYKISTYSIAKLTSTCFPSHSFVIEMCVFGRNKKSDACNESSSAV
jgi:hypothetical protein